MHGHVLVHGHVCSRVASAMPICVHVCSRVASASSDDLLVERMRLSPLPQGSALKSLRATTMQSVRNLADLHAFLFTQHGAYRAATIEEEAKGARERADGALAQSY